MGDDRTHGTPWSDVNIDGHVCDDSCVLQSVVINDSDDTLHLEKIRKNSYEKVGKLKSVTKIEVTLIAGFSCEVC